MPSSDCPVSGGAAGGGPRLKVLVFAYECSPDRSHVEGSAWKILTRLSRWHDLCVITRPEGYREEIERFLDSSLDLRERLRFEYVSDPGQYHAERARPPVPIKAILGYRRWQRRSYELAIDLHCRHDFDLVHHLRTNTFREPGDAWRLPVPLVWGPTGGTTKVPGVLLRSLARKDALQHAMRNLITDFQLRWSLRVRRAAHKAAVVLAQTTEDQRNFRRFWGIEPWLAHEQATDDAQVQIRRYDGIRPLKLIWVGRLVACKALSLALKTLAHPDLKGRVELHVLGDGPQEVTMHVLADQLGVADQCHWYGWLPPERVLDHMYDSDAFFFSSLLEATSTAVTQALSTGLPVICLKHCGFGDLVDESCGLTTPVGPERQVVGGFRRSIQLLIDEPQKVEALSHGAAARACQFSWDVLAESIDKAYRTAVISKLTSTDGSAGSRVVR